MHSSHCNHRLVCRSIVLVKQDSLHISFPGHFETSLVLLFKVLKYLSSVGLLGRKQCSNKYQERLNLMHAKFHWWGTCNSFLVSLWTFQPTLITSVCFWKYLKGDTGKWRKKRKTSIKFQPFYLQDVQFKSFTWNMPLRKQSQCYNSTDKFGRRT